MAKKQWRMAIEKALRGKGFTKKGARKTAIKTMQHEINSLHPPKPLQQLPDLFLPSRKGRDYFLSLESSSLAERYVKSDLSVILELAPKRNDFPVKLPMREKGEIVNVYRPIFVLQFNACDSSYRNRWDEESVFVVDVEAMDGKNIAITSSVSLHLVHKEIVDSGSGVYAGSFGKRTLKPLFRMIGADGKLCERPRSGWISNLCDDVEPCNIKSGADIMDRIASDSCEFTAQHVIPQRVVKELFPRLAIHLQAGSVTVGRSKESLAELVDVMFGPFEF
jgi:hypothetical protein